MAQILAVNKAKKRVNNVKKQNQKLIIKTEDKNYEEMQKNHILLKEVTLNSAQNEPKLLQYLQHTFKAYQRILESSTPISMEYFRKFQSLEELLIREKDSLLSMHDMFSVCFYKFYNVFF